MVVQDRALSGPADFLHCLCLVTIPYTMKRLPIQAEEQIN